MKKLILILSLYIIASCSSNEEDFDVFNPPNWIQGTWKNDAGETLTFTEHDIKYNKKSEKQISFSLETTKFSSNPYPQQISSTSTLYVVDFSQSMQGSTIRFNFVKSSEKKMESKGYLPGFYTKQ
ncbi:hypothetical protein [Flavobacterium sp. N1736]|uniref:hypothetical protein n=1 Tax=Flavobacterium sp. N1736 TaxID=2986823 RepID=UPI0022242881|nr:hypothetical protein [Flavobacterium sp. N1736]